MASESVGSNERGHVLWRCLCACGAEHVVPAARLRAGATKSCGCLHREQSAARAVARNRTHGYAVGGNGTKEYRAWTAAKARCFNPRGKDYKDYGGRGITMAPEWIDDFPAFLAHIGPAPDQRLSLDRIDNNRGYVPENVRWASWVQQRNNRRAPSQPARLTEPVV